MNLLFFKKRIKYIHLKTGNKYKFIKKILMKHPDTGKWIIGVLYKSCLDNKEYVRSLKSFETHFKKI